MTRIEPGPTNDDSASIREDVTVVPADYFDELVADLDVPDGPSERVAAAHRQLHEIVQTERPS